MGKKRRIRQMLQAGELKGEQTESSLREERDRLLEELEAERTERRRLAECLEVKQRRGFWSRLFGQ